MYTGYLTEYDSHSGSDSRSGSIAAAHSHSSRPQRPQAEAETQMETHAEPEPAAQLDMEELAEYQRFVAAVMSLPQAQPGGSMTVQALTEATTDDAGLPGRTIRAYLQQMEENNAVAMGGGKVFFV
jgi:hypothetical protein